MVETVRLWGTTTPIPVVYECLVLTYWRQPDGTETAVRYVVVGVG